ncbi:MAG TPA: hypothetical protein IAA29_02905 [Candidatus Paenibacillus intestinavium]|nr:hypothetical protein [Candidatus Paenibacillus intestinavium]
MLQFMFQQPEQPPTGKYAEVDQLLEKFAMQMERRSSKADDNKEKWTKFEIWTLGLQASLRELYASHYAAQKFREKIVLNSIKEMDAEQKLDYARYVYFDKNGFIRVFSLLDKLGTFLNALLELKTEKIKAHFSYFTVLRTMRERQVHVKLTKPLNELKELSKEPTHRLRKRRNTETHYMNSEMHDDLIQRTRMYGQELVLENLDQQMNDLAVGLDLAMQSIKLTFEYAQTLVHRN